MLPALEDGKPAVGSAGMAGAYDLLTAIAWNGSGSFAGWNKVPCQGRNISGHAELLFQTPRRTEPGRCLQLAGTTPRSQVRDAIARIREQAVLRTRSMLTRKV